jgi:hypothetical protein
MWVGASGVHRRRFTSGANGVKESMTIGKGKKQKPSQSDFLTASPNELETKGSEKDSSNT